MLRRESLPLLDHALGHEIGVPILLGDIMVDVSKRILKGRLPEIPDLSVAVKALVNQFLPITKPALLEQLRLAIIGIPAAMPDPSPEEEVFSRDKVGIRTSTTDDLPNFFLQLGSHPFIRIKAEHPFI